MRCIHLFQVVGVKHYSMVYGLHGNAAIVHQYGFTIDKRFTRNAVYLAEAINETDLLAIETYKRDTIGSGSPYIMILVFYNGVYDIIVKAILP